MNEISWEQRFSGQRRQKAFYETSYNRKAWDRKAWGASPLVGGGSGSIGVCELESWTVRRVIDIAFNDCGAAR